MYYEDEKINETRTNMIELVLKVYRYLNVQGFSMERSYERYRLIYSNGILQLEGCVDEVVVLEDSYNGVVLGGDITTYGHFPYYWLKSIVEGAENGA